MLSLYKRLLSRSGRLIIIAFWLVIVGVLSATFPSGASQENQNAPTLPSSAESVIANALEVKAFHTGNSLPGILVFYRKTGLTSTNLHTISSFIDYIQHHPLPNQLKNGIPVAGLSPAVLQSMTKLHGTTLAVPINIQTTADSTLLAHLNDLLTKQIHASFGTNVLTRPAASGELVIRLTGPLGIAIDAGKLFKNADVALLAGTTLLILVLLVLIYRSPILPLIPLVSVGFAYGLTSAILGEMAKYGIIVIDAQTISIMTVLMFGAGTDYVLLVVARYREQLGAIEDPRKALSTALSKSAPAVAMSAGTVIIALLALLLSQYGPEHRFAIPFAIGVGTTALASLTFVPAILALLKRGAFFPFVPRPTNLPNRQPTYRVAQLVTGRPWLTAGGTTIVLGILAFFALGIHTTYNLLSALPPTSQSREGFDLLTSAYGAGSLSPTTIMVKGPAVSTNIAPALLKTQLITSVSPPQDGAANGEPIAAYTVILAHDPLSPQAMLDLRAIRTIAKNAVGPNSTIYISGQTATNVDSAQYVNRDTLLILPVVLGIILLLLLVYLRSIVAAVYLIATVVLSFSASLGLGWLVLHFVFHINSWAGGVVLYAFVFLVALGEDYNIFMVSRILQERESNDMTNAVRLGVGATSSVLSAAGLVLAGTFAVLTALPLQILLEFGTVAALGVLVDTFIVRTALVPAITVLLGDHSMWPRKL